MPRKPLPLLFAALAALTMSACAAEITGSMPLAAATDYELKLAEYERVHGPYQEQADAYWNAVAEKRRLRNAKRRAHERIVAEDYVLTQPPVYSGPPRPVDPNAPPQPPAERPEIPVVADFLAAAAQEWHFVPDRPRSEAEFKRAYARAAIAAGLTREQAVGVYCFETGGTGLYDTQAGISATRSKAISPALGYNQLLSTNSVSLLAENGAHFLATLRAKAATLGGERRAALERKIEVLRRMIAFTHSGPQRWSDYERVAKTTAKGMGIHALLLDIDIGPLLQVQKLLNSVHFARAKGYEATLTAAELELMNLTGDGNGIDMVMMPQALRDRVPTANFFQPGGYERNPVARRTKVVAGLVAEIADAVNQYGQAQGARELAAAF